LELTYDISCKYRINLEKRMTKHFPEVVDVINEMSFYIPDMHIKAHQDSCQKRFRRDFGQFTGKCDGEGTERLWAEMNQWAPSLSEMSFGRHHDIVDDNISDWNLRKVLGMGKFN
ncbi:hypothetical protein M422DRAFT_161437, partial [Sphaerobolus stellatus SS14]